MPTSSPPVVHAEAGLAIVQDPDAGISLFLWSNASDEALRALSALDMDELALRRLAQGQVHLVWHPEPGTCTSAATDPGHRQVQLVVGTRQRIAGHRAARCLDRRYRRLSPAEPSTLMVSRPVRAPTNPQVKCSAIEKVSTDDQSTPVHSALRTEQRAGQQRRTAHFRQGRNRISSTRERDRPASATASADVAITPPSTRRSAPERSHLTFPFSDETILPREHRRKRWGRTRPVHAPPMPARVPVHNRLSSGTGCTRTCASDLTEPAGQDVHARR